MLLYLIRAHDRRRGWDLSRGFVVAAPSAGAARREAARVATRADHLAPGDPEERQFWQDLERTECAEIGTYTGPETAPHVVLQDYLHG